MIWIESRRKKEETLRRAYPEASIVDVTSKSEYPWVRFSPFFPHGKIPIPFSPGHFGQSVEGIWQGLKVFEKQGIDPEKFDIKTMKGLKRTVRKHGRVKGHQQGVEGDGLFSYLEARQRIYIPVYTWVLEHHLQKELQELAVLATTRDLILLDYETNTDINDLKRPLSHAGLIRSQLEHKQ